VAGVVVVIASDSTDVSATDADADADADAMVSGFLRPRFLLAATVEEDITGAGSNSNGTGANGSDVAAFDT